MAEGDGGDCLHEPILADILAPLVAQYRIIDFLYFWILSDS